MSEVQTIHAVSKEQIDELAAFLTSMMPKNGWRIKFTEWRDSRTLSQNAFQHAIYTDISRYLISRGRTEYTPEFVKMMLKNKFLGWTEFEFVDVVTGERTKRQILRSTAGLDKGEAQRFTEQILEWSESIGCHINIPANSEYMKYREAQCG